MPHAAIPPTSLPKSGRSDVLRSPRDVLHLINPGYLDSPPLHPPDYCNLQGAHLDPDASFRQMDKANTSGNTQIVSPCSIQKKPDGALPTLQRILWLLRPFHGSQRFIDNTELECL
ncbi:uncharacterized protein V6R79_009852 [Siganus canaliculatus]